MDSKTRRTLEEASRDLGKLQREIAPFVKKRQFERRTTAGQWRPTSTLSKNRVRHRDDMEHAVPD